MRLLRVLAQARLDQVGLHAAAPARACRPVLVGCPARPGTRAAGPGAAAIFCHSDGEVAGLVHQHRVARAQRVGQRRLPRAGARGRIDRPPDAGSGTPAGCPPAPSARARRTRGRGGRWWAGSSRAGCGRAPGSGPGSAGSGGRWDGSRVAAWSGPFCLSFACKIHLCMMDYPEAPAVDARQFCIQNAFEEIKPWPKSSKSRGSALHDQVAARLRTHAGRRPDRARRQAQRARAVRAAARLAHAAARGHQAAGGRGPGRPAAQPRRGGASS